MSAGPARRRLGPHIAVVAVCGLAVVGALGGIDASNAMPFTAVAAFVAGRLRPHVVAAAGLGLLVAAAVTTCVLTAFDANIVPAVMLPVTLWCAGFALRERDDVARRLQVHNAELEAEREAYARLSVRYERARIAAELHDVVAHAISVMVVQASAGQRLVSAAPEAADETFRVIGDAARQAGADLGRLAELLTADPGDAPGADLGLVEAVVERAGQAGLEIRLRLQGDRDALRGPAARAASRVVQEGLTNALRYAPGAVVRVTIRALPGGVDVEVANGAAPAAGTALGLGSGRGLTGLREAVEAVGGRLDAGPHGDGWCLAARLPVAAVPVA